MGQKYRKKEESIRNNLKQYGLEDKFLDVLVGDFSTSYLKDSILFDAIITDPPYGIREKAKKVGTKKSKRENDELKDSSSSSDQENNELNYVDIKNESLNDENSKKLNDPRYAQTTKYNLGDIFNDLLTFASQHLIEYGRLVYWLPIYLEIDRSTIR